MATRDEIKHLMETIVHECPNFTVSKERIEEWVKGLSKYAPSLLLRAVDYRLRQSSFPPTWQQVETAIADSSPSAPAMAARPDLKGAMPHEEGLRYFRSLLKQRFPEALK